MPFAAPFFAAFGPLLFGRAPRAAHELYQRQLPKADSISALREAFGSMIPDALLCPQPKGRASRQRLFSPLVTFWTFLAQVLSPHSTCRDAVRKAQAWWALRHQVDISPATSAYCQALSPAARGPAATHPWAPERPAGGQCAQQPPVARPRR